MTTKLVTQMNKHEIAQNAQDIFISSIEKIIKMTEDGILTDKQIVFEALVDFAYNLDLPELLHAPELLLI